MPVVLTVLCAAAVVASASTASGAAVPVPVALDSGHWVVNGAIAAAVHVHGGTAQVDARVDLPPGAAGDGSAAVAGASEGFVVAGGRVWTFDRSTLTVVSDEAAAAREAPVPIEVVGGPYLVYRQAGTIVRLGDPAVVVEAGGPLGPPVRTPDGTVVVHRPDTGEVCALRRDAPELDCSISTRPGAVGGLSVVGSNAVFVDTAGDAGYRVLLGAGLDGGTPLGVDLPGDAQLGDRAVGDRLPVVVPGENVLRLVDVGGLEQLRPGGPPIDVPLGEGAFSAPVVGESAIALLDLATGRLLTFSPDGVRTGETRLPQGTTAADLTRAEDGRLYLDEPGGRRTHVVQPGGAVATVDIGDGTGPAVAVAPPPEQLAPVRPPLPGQVAVPTDVQALPAGAPGGGAVVGVPGAGGVALPLPGEGGDPLPGPPPDPQQPPDGAPPPDADPGAPPPDPGAPPPDVVEPPAADAPPGAPPQLTAQRDAASGTVELDWEPPAGPVDHYVVAVDGVEAFTTDVVDSAYADPENVCWPYVRYDVSAIGPTGQVGPTATAYAEGEVGDCTPGTEIVSAEATPDGYFTVQIRCFAPPGNKIEESTVFLMQNDEAVRMDKCRLTSPGSETRITFLQYGLASGSTLTLEVRSHSRSGHHYSDPVTVTIP